MIYTGSYSENLNKSDNLVSISSDKGIIAGFSGIWYEKLAPNKELNDEFFNSIVNTDNCRYFIRKYMKSNLANLNPKNVFNELDGKILLCYEESYEFCHRHIVALWLEDKLNIEVPEIGYAINGEKITFNRPGYIKEIYEQEKLLLKR